MCKINKPLDKMKGQGANMVDFEKLEKLAQEKIRLDEKMKEFREQAIDEIVSLLDYVKIFSSTNVVTFNSEDWDTDYFLQIIADILKGLKK